MCRRRLVLCFLGAGILCLSPGFGHALTPEQVIQLKKAGVQDATIQLMISQEMAGENRNPYDTMGTKEIRDADGNTVVIYSTGKPGGGAFDPEEREKLDRAWEMLRNLIIDAR
ncbi:MAG: hypothetical protein WCX84_09810 [Syntrophales bacterium]|jgi:hypothetical protein|nr:hypothetical protein [Syntrophales bacterium]NLN60133.1 hypothetical protein [Deltaproteobacteria bacterium]